MSAGSGYQYLLRSVAAGDSSRALSTPLTRYYWEVGTPPGRWLGAGVRALGSGQLAAGMPVTEEQLALLIGMGRDPITGEQVGRAYPTYKRLTDRIDERVAALDPEMTQEDCAAETSRIEAEETAAGMRHAVAGFDLTFSVPKVGVVLWGVADAAIQERIADAHHKPSPTSSTSSTARWRPPVQVSQTATAPWLRSASPGSPPSPTTTSTRGPEIHSSTPTG
jgi:hypothetical protein